MSSKKERRGGGGGKCEEGGSVEGREGRGLHLWTAVALEKAIYRSKNGPPKRPGRFVDCLERVE